MHVILDWLGTVLFMIAFGLTLAVFDVACRITFLIGKRPSDYVMGALQTTLVWAMHLAGIGKFFRRGGGRGGLIEFAETGTGIGKAPGRQFDMKRVQRVDDTIGLFIGNHDMATRTTIICGFGVPRQTVPGWRRRFRHAEQRVPFLGGGSDG